MISKWEHEQMEGEMARQSVAADIAVEAGVLERCIGHEEILIDLYGDPQEAYALAKKKLDSGDLDVRFDSIQELKDTIDSVVTESGDECPICAKNMTKDYIPTGSN